MRELMTHRDFRLLLTGQTLSMFGSVTMMLVFGMWAKELTGSNSIAGLMILAMAAPAIFAPFLGVLIDRTSRRRLMIITDIVMGGVLLTLFTVDGREDLWLLFVVAACYGASSIAFYSAKLALLATILPEHLLGQANATLRTLRESFRLIGPLIGAGIFATAGGAAVAAIDAATFLCSALVLGVMRVREPRRAPAEHHVLAEISAGVRHLTGDPILRRATGMTVALMLVLGMVEPAIFAVVDDGLGRPVEFLGVLISVQGVGAILGGVTMMALIGKVGPLRPLWIGLFLLAIAAAGLMFATLGPVFAGMLLAGIGLPPIAIAVDTLIQTRTPDALRGRVGTAMEVAFSAPQTVSIAAGAVLLGLVDYRLIFAIVACVAALCGLYSLLWITERAASAVRPIESPQPCPAVSS